jgi:hypothetical protein
MRRGAGRALHGLHGVRPHPSPAAGRGSGRSDGGLAYSVAYNYLNKVVNGRAIGQRIFFQGGVASNAGVGAAFRQLLGKDVTVPPDHDVTGAIGAAILAQEWRIGGSADQRTRNPEPRTQNLSGFKGFDLTEHHYTMQSFECRACPNLCEVSRVTVAGEPPMYTGARCERFEEAGRRPQSRRRVPDYVGERLALWLGDYDESARVQAAVKSAAAHAHHLRSVPYWRAAVCELVSAWSLRCNQSVYCHVTAETATAETGFRSRRDGSRSQFAGQGRGLRLLCRGS